LSEVVEDGARKAGRGALKIAAAKGMFLFTGLALAMIMPRLIVDAEGAQDTTQYGNYRFAAWVMTILAQTLILGVLQVVSKFAAERREATGSVVAFLLPRLLPVLLVIGALAQTAVPFIAAAVGDPRLVPLLRIALLIPVLYGVYGVFLGAANGAEAFGLQSLLDGTFSLLKASLIVGVAWLAPAALSAHDPAAAGALMGWVLAAAVITVIAALGTGPLRRRSREPLVADPKQMIRFAGGIGLFAVTFELLKVLDGLVVKAATARIFDAAEAGHVAGLYAVGLDFSRIPYFLVVGISLVLFPMMSKASFAADQERVATYIRNACRFTFGLATVTAVGTLVAAPGLLPAIAGPAYVDAVPFLQVLCLGQIGFALFTIAMNILNASGRPLLAWSVVFTAVVLAAGALPLGISAFGVIGGAWASAAVMWAAAGIGLWRVRRVFGVALSPPTFFRVLVAGALCAAFTLVFVPSNLIGGLAALAGVGLADLAILIALRELGTEDWALVRRVIG
jgi:stage V sporulation protein B